MGVKAGQTGKLKIGDDWNAITIIALSQSNPLKAVAEFVWGALAPMCLGRYGVWA